MFFKPTDINKFHHVKSCDQCVDNGQTIKIKRICSTGENLGICLGQLMQWLVTWDYKQDQVQSKDFIQ